MWGRVLDLLDTHTARVTQILGMFTVTLVVVFALIDRANLAEANTELVKVGRQERVAASAERTQLIEGQKELRTRIRELREQNERIVQFFQERGINVPSSVLSPSRIVVQDDDSSDDSSDDSDDPVSGSNTPNPPTTNPPTPDGDMLEDTIKDLTDLIPDVLNQTEPLLGQPDE